MPQLPLHRITPISATTDSQNQPHTPTAQTLKHLYHRQRRPRQNTGQECSTINVYCHGLFAVPLRARTAVRTISLIYPPLICTLINNASTIALDPSRWSAKRTRTEIMNILSINRNRLQRSPCRYRATHLLEPPGTSLKQQPSSRVSSKRTPSGQPLSAHVSGPLIGSVVT